MLLFVCHGCGGDPCELRVNPDPAYPPDLFPFRLAAEPRWREVPSGRSTGGRA